MTVNPPAGTSEPGCRRRSASRRGHHPRAATNACRFGFAAAGVARGHPAAGQAPGCAAGRDEAGNRLEVLVHQDGGAPLRCCLRESRAGDRLLLIAYTPPGTAGAYAERGPVFIHAERCAGYPTPGRYPPELAARQQVVRAYDKQGRIADGVLAADGPQAEEVIAELLARPDVELVHLRNVGYGCYNSSVRATG